MSDRTVKVRIGLTAAFLLLAVAGLGTRLAFLHLLTEENVRESIGKNRKIESELDAPRGKIFDRGGQENILALDLVMKDTCADPSVIAREQGDVSEIAAALASEFDVSRDELEQKLSRKKSQFVRLLPSMPEEKVRGIESKKFPGVFTKERRRRFYPHGNFMCHVLGFVNHEGYGSAGLEQRMQKYLKGSPGYIATGVDARRHELYLKREQFVAPVEGADVTLTIDQNVQYMVEKAIDETMTEHNAKGAWIIVQRVKTGEILAMASRPGYDLNDFRYSSENQRLNRAVGYVYEPGSTFKVVTIGAAINERIVTPKTVIDCERGTWFYARKPLHDCHPYGKLTVEDGIKKSSNILTAKVAVKLGEKKLYDYLRAFRVGRPMGIDLPGEEAGILHPLKKWSGISVTRIPIGQGVSVTALQMLGIYCTIANDGYMMQPHVVKQISSCDGSVIYSARPEVIARPIRGSTASTMRDMLARVTEKGGTGWRAAIEGIPVAGKTGSAQKPVNGGYSDTAYIASFVGFFPVESPEVAMIVVVDDPQPRHTGGAAAGPAFRKIGTELARYLDVAPEERTLASR